jgi:dihydrodipicolinate synthase/N-acetylneuraminate lyase
MARGAAGAVSGMAAALPDVVRAALDAPDGAETELRGLRLALESSGTFIASVKHVLGLRGVPVRPDMRAPLPPLSAAAAVGLDAMLAGLGLLEGADV